MTTSLLLEHFDGLVVTPDDVDVLNQTILQLAIQGKLLTQNNADENAAEILKRIQTAKSNLNIKELFSPIGNDEKPFELPKGWEWTRLNDVCYQITDGTHYTPKYLYDGVPFLSVKDVSKGFLDFSNTRFISQEEYDLFASRCKPEFGDVILTKVGTTGIAVVVDTEKEFSIFVSLALLKFFQSEIAPDYLALVINSPFVKKQSEKYTMGVGNKNLVLKHIKSFPIPLPPLAEQQRIVARVEELFAQTGALAKQLAHARAALDGLNNSALAHLLASETSGEFEQQWAFIAEHFDLLFQAPEHVAPLRQSILELAVRGKLTRREAGDESARELLGRISEEKTKIRKKETLAPIKDGDKPFKLPNAWEWTRLVSIADIGTGSTPLRSNPDYYQNGTIPWATSSATNNPFISKTDELITDDAMRDTRLRIYPKHTLLVALYGQGKTRGQVSELLIESTVNQACASLVFTGHAQNLRAYIKIFLLKNYREIRLLAEGGAQPNLNLEKIKQTIIPLPPLAEQERIVERVEQLLSLCDALEGRLRAAQEQRGKLVGAVMAQVGV